MTLPAAVADCSVCPRLCRDVCPVAVHAFRDDFIPSEKMRGVAAALGHAAGVADAQRLLACTDCGACSAYCLLSIPVAPWLAEARARLSIATQQVAAVAEAPQIERAMLPARAVMLPVCLPSDPPAHHRDEAGAPRDTGGSSAAGLRCVPAIATSHDADAPTGVHVPALGSNCCGARLDPSVGDADLRDRMAAAMMAQLPDESLVVVHNPHCAAHLRRVAAGRVDVRSLAASEDSANRGEVSQEDKERLQ